MEDLVPAEFYLSQNYPNPFKEKTTIKYCVPDKTLIKLTLLGPDMTIIEELENEIKEAGTYELVYDGTCLTQGDYFYRLQAGDPTTGSGQVFVETKKMLLLK
jgi:hypothetical protein